jgi:methionyl aminopeptidase
MVADKKDGPSPKLRDMSVESQDDIDGLLKAGRVVALALERMRAAVCEGVTTRDLDEVGAAVFRAHGARSAPHLTYGFPGTNCISVNDEAVHGVPSARRLRAGDVVKLDVTAELDGYMADAAVTVTVGPPSPLAQRLVGAAERSLAAALSVVRPGLPVNEIGRTVEHEVKRAGFKVLRDLGGHGIGRTIHEPPSIPNHYISSNKTPLTDGLVITIEPIIAATTSRITGTGSDGWTISTADQSLSAHAEHTLIVLNNGPLILTAAA